MSNHEYRVYPEKNSTNISGTFNLVFKIIEQENISANIKTAFIIPSYIATNQIKIGRQKFVNSFFYPKSKKEWRTIYNLKNLEYGRNFYSGTINTGTEGVKIRDRRYKKGYRVEYHKKYGKTPKHHIFLPWSPISIESKESMKTEFDKILNEIIKKNNQGKRVVLGLIIGITIILSWLIIPIIIGIILFFHLLPKI